ncbi:hypothetical protein PHBOTO_006328, partial [Pseudozyma hubeiensis]
GDARREKVTRPLKASYATGGEKVCIPDENVPELRPVMTVRGAHGSRPAHYIPIRCSGSQIWLGATRCCHGLGCFCDSFGISSDQHHGSKERLSFEPSKACSHSAEQVLSSGDCCHCDTLTIIIPHMHAALLTSFQVYWLASLPLLDPTDQLQATRKRLSLSAAAAEPFGARKRGWRN